MNSVECGVLMPVLQAQGEEGVWGKGQGAQLYDC